MSDLSGATTVRPRRRGLQRFSRFPVRLAAQWIIGVGVLVFAGVGIYKTLALGLFGGAAWRDLIVYGVGQGAIYAMIALGYTMVYGILKMINFAHGEVFMAGALGSSFVARTLQSNGLLDSNPVLAIAILMVVAMVISGFIAFLLERVAYRPLRNAPRLVPLITAIGASLFLQNTFRGFFGAQAQRYPKPHALDGSWTILGVQILRMQAVVILVAIVSLVALAWFVARTRTGKSMRAVAEDREIAGLMGINVDRVIVITFLIGGALAGIAGVLFAMLFGGITPFSGFIPGIKAFTAAVLGGIGSIYGAALGGLIIGLLESLGPALLLTGYGIPATNQLKDVIFFTILVLVLIFRPGGIMGTGEAEKV